MVGGKGFRIELQQTNRSARDSKDRMKGQIIVQFITSLMPLGIEMVVLEARDFESYSLQLAKRCLSSVLQFL